MAMPRCSLAQGAKDAKGPRAARGSVAVNTIIALSLIFILLIGSELGFLAHQKRELQKAVDLAALAGAQSVDADDCAPARSAALTNANGTGINDPARNLPPSLMLEAADIECGSWSLDAPTADGQHFNPEGAPFNAVRITAQKTPPSLLPFFPGSRTVHAMAIAAADEPMAAFSVGSTLLRTGDSLLGDLLKGIGLDLTGTSLVGYEGLTQVQITPAGLLQALGIPVATDIGVGELDALLAAQNVQLGSVLNAIVTLADHDALLGANASLLSAIQARTGLSSLMVQLGSLTGAGGLFASIEAPNTASALGAQVNALDLVYTAIAVATQRHAIEVPSISALNNVVNARVAVIEPPSIAIGGVGATAYTAQVRTFVDIDTGNLPVIGSIARIKLPVMIDVVNGRGTLTEMCTPALRNASGEERAEIAVEASILKVCVGRPGANPAVEDEIFSTVNSCEQNLADEDLLRLNLLGDNLASWRTHLDIDALPLAGTVVLAEGETGTVGNELLLGTTLRDITDALLAALLGQTLDQPPALTPAQRQSTAQALWNDQGGPCPNRQCRSARLAAVMDDIDDASTGLGGFLGSLSANTLTIVHELLNLDVLGLLQGIGDLVGGLLNTVGNVLGAVLGILTGHPCTGGGLFNAPGSDAECVNNIANAISGSSSTQGQSVPNAVIALTGFLLDLLQPVLDALGSAVLTPLLRDVLGLRLGEIDIHLHGLNCQAQARLVY